MTGYALPNGDDAAESRLRALAELFDPTTFRHLEALGVAPGSRCWEVGAGGASVVRWLAARVGPSGRVLATDLDVSRIGAVPGAEIRVHDLARDPTEAGAFDVIHARLVLVHVEARDEALARLVAALRPGGRLLVEDADPALQPLACLEARDQDAELANRLRVAFRTLLEERGADLAYGRSLPRRLRAAGLVDVGAAAYFPVVLPACAALERATFAQVGERLVARGLATAAELARHLANVDAGRVDIALSPLISAWGRRSA
jgi:SAM-dependent methyltransferase